MITCLEDQISGSHLGFVARRVLVKALPPPGNCPLPATTWCDNHLLVVQTTLISKLKDTCRILLFPLPIDNLGHFHPQGMISQKGWYLPRTNRGEYRSTIFQDGDDRFQLELYWQIQLRCPGGVVNRKINSWILSSMFSPPALEGFPACIYGFVLRCSYKFTIG